MAWGKKLLLSLSVFATCASSQKHTVSLWLGCINTTALLKPCLTQIFPHREVDGWGVFEWAVLGGHGRVLTLIRISLWFWDFNLCNFMDLIYAQSACNTPKRMENLKSHYMTPLNDYPMFATITSLTCIVKTTTALLTSALTFDTNMWIDLHSTG